VLLAMAGIVAGCSSGGGGGGDANQAPSSPAGVLATATSDDTIKVSFQTATDDGGVAEYRIHRYGEEVGETEGTTYDDTGLVFGTAFCYTVTAVDGDGVESAPSTEVCATTQQAPSGTIATWAGDGTQGYDGDGNLLSKSRFDQPMEMSFDLSGTAYVVDWNSHRIRRVVSGRLETVIGSDLPGDWPCQEPADPSNCEVPLTDPLDAALLPMNHPMDITFGHHSAVAYVAAWHNHKMQRYDSEAGQVTILAGQQAVGFSGDGGAASLAKLNFPSSVVIDVNENLLFSDERNNRIRRIDTGGIITTVAGISNVSAYAGDGGTPTAANLALQPYINTSDPNPPPGGGLALGLDGTLYVADTFNHCIRMISPGADGVIGSGDTEAITTLSGSCGNGNEGYSGDGGPAAAATFGAPFDLDFGPEGDLYVADTGNHAVRAINLTTGIIRTVAGTGVAGFSGDDGPATSAQFKSPYGIAFDATGNLYVVDTFNNRIRIIAK